MAGPSEAARQRPCAHFGHPQARGTVTRRSAADVYDEIQSAKAAQEAADAEARRVLREQRRAEYKDKWEQFKNTLKSAVT